MSSDFVLVMMSCHEFKMTKIEIKFTMNNYLSMARNVNHTKTKIVENSRINNPHTYLSSLLLTFRVNVRY